MALTVNEKKCFLMPPDRTPASVWQNYQPPSDWIERLSAFIFHNLSNKKQTTEANICSKLKAKLSSDRSDLEKLNQILQKITALVTEEIVDNTLAYRKNDKTPVADKLFEGLQNCLDGFMDRCYALWLSWELAKNCPERLAKFREEIVLRVAIKLSDEVHGQNKVSIFAKRYGYGTQAINPTDFYSGNIKDETIVINLQEAFASFYTNRPLFLVKAIADQLSGDLSNFG